MKLSGFGGGQGVQPVPVPVQTEKLAIVFGSVISIGALKLEPLITIFEVGAFANNLAGIATKNGMIKTESSRFTIHHHILFRIRSPEDGMVNSRYTVVVATRWDEKAGLRTGCSCMLPSYR